METLGVDSRTRVKRLGAKERARRKKCQVRFSVILKNKAFRKNFMKESVKKLLRAGMMPARTCRGVVRKMASRAKRRVDETDSRSSDVETGERACRSSDV